MSNYNHARFRTSLNRPVTLMGGERTPVLVALLISAYFGFIFFMGGAFLKGLMVAVGLWAVFFGILVRMGKADLQMAAVFRRHMRYKSFYPARGRYDAFVPEPKPFIKRR